MPDVFRYPFIRSNNYLGAYNVIAGKNALPVLEDMQFDAVALSPVSITANLIDANDTLASTISTATTLTLSASLSDQNDTLSATLSAANSASISASLVDANDAISASLNISVSVTVSFADANDTLNSALNVSVGLSGNLQDQDDVLTASLSTASPVSLTGALQDEQDFIAGSISISDVPPAQPRDIGDAGDILRRKKPIIMYRPKAVQQLEEAQEELESIRPIGRVSENKKKVKAALAIVKAIDPPPSYAENIASIEAALKNVSRETAKHEGMQSALISVMLKIQDTMAAIQAEKAAQRKRNLEKILWLL